MKKDYSRTAVAFLLSVIFITVYVFHWYVGELVIPPPREITYYRVNVHWEEGGRVSFDLINKVTGKKEAELFSMYPGEDGFTEGYATMTIGVFDAEIVNDDLYIDNFIISDDEFWPNTVEFSERKASKE